MRITAASLALLTFMGGCANTNVNNDNDINTLPKKCGRYDLLYGIPIEHKKENRSVADIILNGKPLSYLKAEYRGKEVAIFAEMEILGGILTPDGSGGDADIYYSPIEVLPLKREDGLLNRDKIEKMCRKLAYKKIQKED